MKKKLLIFIFLLSALPLSLTSCRVNWFDRQYDVPWWYVAVPTAIISAIFLLIGGLALSSNRYRCPKCQKTFKPKWWKTLFTVHFMSERVLKCHYCGRKGFCQVTKEEEE